MDEILRKNGHLIKNGFFIEAGAGGGEFLSNTIFFELKHNWKGLLVEPNPDFFPELKHKQRNAWILPHCLSPSRKVELVDFDAALYNGGIIVPDRDFPSDLGWQSHFSTFYDREEIANERSMTVGYSNFSDNINLHIYTLRLWKLVWIFFGSCLLANIRP